MCVIWNECFNAIQNAIPQTLKEEGRIVKTKIGAMGLTAVILPMTYVKKEGALTLPLLWLAVLTIDDGKACSSRLSSD